jgi:hypothetical protein
MYRSSMRARYKLSVPVKAVKLEEHPGSSLRNPTSTLIEIPPNVIVEMEGAVAPSGLVSVLWGSIAFSVFYEDLLAGAHMLGSDGGDSDGTSTGR